MGTHRMAGIPGFGIDRVAALDAPGGVRSTRKEEGMKRSGKALVVVILLAAAVIGPNGTAASAASKATYYLALGNSVAEGGQPIGNGTQGYPEQLYKAVQSRFTQLQLIELACGGETTGTVISGGNPYCSFPEGSQLDAAVAFLEDHPGEVAFITIDIGANDILGSCVDFTTLLIDADCVDAVLPTLQANLATILGTLHAAAPGAPVVGMDYYNPFLGAWVFGPGGQAVALADAPIVVDLNAALVATYQAEGTLVADVSEAFDSSNFSQTVETKDFGTIPVNVANVCAWTWFCEKPPHGPGDVHPNSEGHEVIARAFEEVVPE
jgi:lysophospholipase L1-like esterase